MDKKDNKQLVWVVKKQIGDSNVCLCDVKGTTMYWGTKQNALDFLKLINFSDEEIEELDIVQVPISECEGTRNIVEYEVRETNQ